MTLEQAKEYLKSFDKLSDEAKAINKRAFEDAQQLSAWVSIAEHGSDKYKKQALRIIKSI